MKMNEHPIGSIMEQTMQKLREMVDANTIIGTPITTPDGVWIVPVSKLSFGFGCGGSDIAGGEHKHEGKTGEKCSDKCGDSCSQSSHRPQILFGGGSGAGVNVTPVGFLVVSDGNVRMLPVSAPLSTSADRIIDMLPGIIDKVSNVLKKKKDEQSFED